MEEEFKIRGFSPLLLLLPLLGTARACGFGSSSEASTVTPEENPLPGPTQESISDDPNIPLDSDRDGIIDVKDPRVEQNDFFDESFSGLDSDGDGLLDRMEEYLNITYGFNLDINSIDSSRNGITDVEELLRLTYGRLNPQTGFSPIEIAQLITDSDGDGYTDEYEIKKLKSDPNDIDSDDDGIIDSWDSLPTQKALGSILPDGYNNGQIDIDTDKDGITDAAEDFVGSDSDDYKVIITSGYQLDDIYGSAHPVIVYNVDGVEVKGIKFLSDVGKYQNESIEEQLSSFSTGSILEGSTTSEYNCNFYVLSRIHPEKFDVNDGSWVNDDIQQLFNRDFTQEENYNINEINGDLDDLLNPEANDVVVFRSGTGILHSVFVDEAGSYSSKLGHNGLLENHDLDEFLTDYAGQITSVELYRRN